MIPRFFRSRTATCASTASSGPACSTHGPVPGPCAGHADPPNTASGSGRPGCSRGARRRAADVLEERMRPRPRAGVRAGGPLPRHARRARDAGRAPADDLRRLEAIDFWAEYREGTGRGRTVRMREGRILGGGSSRWPTPPSRRRSTTRFLPQFYADQEPAPEIVLPRLPREAALIEDSCAGACGRWRCGPRCRATSGASRPGRAEREAGVRGPLPRHARHGVQMLEELRDVLGLDEPPFRIEGSMSVTSTEPSRAPRWWPSKGASRRRPTTGSSKCGRARRRRLQAMREVVAGATRGSSARGSAFRTSC